MNRRVAGYAVAALVLVCAQKVSAEAPGEPLTLEECYRLALAQSEKVAIRTELIKQNQGRIVQSLSGVLPQASFVMTDRRQDGTGDSAFSLKRIPERRFAFSQPIFSGFKEFAAIAGARAERHQRLEDRRRAEQLLLVDVADAFYLLLEQREDMSALEMIRSSIEQRLVELEERERLGRTRPSEVAGAGSQLARIDAEIEAARSRETVARQLLAFLTGRESIEAVRDDEDPPLLQEGVETFLARVGDRPDVRSADDAAKIAGRQVVADQARLWPTVTLEGNYYTKRAGISENIDWDAMLVMSVPLFQGGLGTGKVRESISQSKQARLVAQQARREAELQVRDLHARFRSALAQTEALGKARDAAQENYRLQAEDYRLNLVNNLEVLQALQELEDARRSAISAQYAAKRLNWQLRAAVGEGL